MRNGDKVPDERLQRYLTHLRKWRDIYHYEKVGKPKDKWLKGWSEGFSEAVQVLWELIAKDYSKTVEKEEKNDE